MWTKVQCFTVGDGGGSVVVIVVIGGNSIVVIIGCVFGVGADAAIVVV